MTVPRFTPALTRLRSAPAGLVLALVLTCQLMVVLDATIVNIALHDIQQSLHFSPTGLSWVVNAYTLTFGGLLLLGARLGDIAGRRTSFLAGLTLFTVASLAGGLAADPTALLVSRAAQGVGAALASPAALALLMTTFGDGAARVRAIGLYTAVSIGGAAIGLIAGGALAQWASWRWVFFINVPFGVAVVLLGALALPAGVRRPGRLDVPGALTSTIGMTALVYGFVHAAEAGWTDLVTTASFGIGVVLLAAFVVVERRAAAPITPLRLFADRVRSGAYVARLLMTAGMMGMFFFLTQFLRLVLGYSDLRTGFAFVPLTVAVFVSSQLASRVLVERFGGRRLMIAGASLSLLGMLGLTQLSASSGYLSLLLPLVVYGTGNGLAFVPLTTAALQDVDPQDAGAASGLVNVMQQLGGSLGLAVLVTVFGDAAGSSAAGSAAAFVSGADAAFRGALVFVGLTWLIVTFVLRRRRRVVVPDDVSGLAYEDLLLAEDPN